MKKVALIVLATVWNNSVSSSASPPVASSSSNVRHPLRIRKKNGTSLGEEFNFPERCCSSRNNYHTEDIDDGNDNDNISVNCNNMEQRVHTHTRGGSSSSPVGGVKGLFLLLTSSNPPFLFLPNLIGYLRIALLIVAFQAALHDPNTAIFCYMTSFSMDVLDGKAARWLSQESNLGSLLDMLTDRVATLGLLFVLSHVFPQKYLGFFLGSAVLDVTSHWARMVESAKKGLHHKMPVKRENLHPVLAKFNIVKYYYSTYWFFAYCCVAAELTYVSLYYLAFNAAGDVGYERVKLFLQYGCALGWGVKQITNIQQLFVSCASMDY